MSDYQTGFGNHFATEAIPGALPIGRNSPQKPAFGLYTEQLSGTAFTAPRHENRHTWLYRLRPSAAHPAFIRYEGAKRFAPGLSKSPLAPNRLRWRPADGATFQEIQQQLRWSAVAKTWESASRSFRLATIVGRFAEVLRGSYWARQGAHGDDLAELARRAAQVSEDWPRQERVAELISLIGRARDLRRAP